MGTSKEQLVGEVVERAVGPVLDALTLQTALAEVALERLPVVCDPQVRQRAIAEAHTLRRVLAVVAAAAASGDPVAAQRHPDFATASQLVARILAEARQVASRLQTDEA